MSYMNYKEAAAQCWVIRRQAESSARERGNTDPGLRAGATSGRHLDPLANLVRSLLLEAGLRDTEVHTGTSVELPGYFRAEKKWDLVAVRNGALIAAIEFKSILGSYGNNMNNRVEEALGSATDLRHAAERGLVGTRPPWLGFVFLMTEEPQSTQPVSVREPHFPVDPVFRESSYLDRYILLFRRLVLQRMYDSVCLLTGDGTGNPAAIREPAEDLTWAKFETALRGRIAEILA